MLYSSLPQLRYRSAAPSSEGAFLGGRLPPLQFMTGVILWILAPVFGRKFRLRKTVAFLWRICYNADNVLFWDIFPHFQG